jgi:hypothetical protein
LLRKAGFSNFFLQKKPFEGKMFNQFDFSELVSVGVEFYEVVERIFGNEKEILEVFYFSAAESSLNNEIYNLLKEKFKAELGVKIMKLIVLDWLLFISIWRQLTQRYQTRFFWLSK